MGELSDFAREVNEARDPGSSSPERVWAVGIIRGMVRRYAFRISHRAYVAPNGDVFRKRFIKWVDNPYGGPGRTPVHGYTINGMICGARDFEVRLADHAPKEVSHERD